MGRAGAYLFAAGAALALVAVAMPPAPGADEAGTLAVAAGATAGAGVLVWGIDRMRPWTFQLLAIYGTLLVTAAIHSGGVAAKDTGIVYLWIVLFSFYFFTGRQALVQLGAIALAYGVLSGGSEEGSLTRWGLTVLTLLVAGALVWLLKEWVGQLVARLSDAARTDPLTGTLNRRGFEELLELELERARRYGRAVSLLALDLDRFKQVNDRFGHQAGDAALMRAADALTEEKRRIDILGRIGGEEFAVLVPDTDENGAYVLAERLRHRLRDAFAGQPAELTVSIGIAAMPAHAQGLQSLMSVADQALYAAKQLGRDRCVIFSPEVAGIISAGLVNGRAGRDDLQLATVLTLAETLDIRDTGTARHSQTAGRYAETMARELELDPGRIERVRLAGILHDVGKIGVPDSVLRKPGPLTGGEWEEMRKHPEIGARILGASSFDDIRPWVLSHHERPDGRGYPHGTSGDEIPLEARILAVADAYEAMTSDRVYRPGMDPRAAREELRSCAGTQFDRQVVEAFLAALEREPSAEAADKPAAAAR